MTDLKKYVKKRKAKDSTFAEGYESGYSDLKPGAILREARVSAGFTQEELAKKLKTKKRLFQELKIMAEDIRLSTLENVPEALGKTLKLSIC